MSSLGFFNNPESGELAPRERCSEQQDDCMLEGISFGSKEYSHGFLDEFPADPSDEAFGGSLVEEALQNTGAY